MNRVIPATHQREGRALHPHQRGGWAYGAISGSSAKRTRALPGWLDDATTRASRGRRDVLDARAAGGRCARRGVRPPDRAPPDHAAVPDDGVDTRLHESRNARLHESDHVADVRATAAGPPARRERGTQSEREVKCTLRPAVVLFVVLNQRDLIELRAPSITQPCAIRPTWGGSGRLWSGRSRVRIPSLTPLGKPDAVHAQGPVVLPWFSFARPGPVVARLSVRSHLAPSGAVGRGLIEAFRPRGTLAVFCARAPLSRAGSLGSRVHAEESPGGWSRSSALTRRVRDRSRWHRRVSDLR